MKCNADVCQLETNDNLTLFLLTSVSQSVSKRNPMPFSDGLIGNVDM